jgi:EmrB/QacA subfamily drug resistance transporter
VGHGDDRSGGPTTARTPGGIIIDVGERERAAARRRWGVLAICCTSLFLVGLDTTIVNVALPSIARDLRVGTRGIEWTVDAYTLAMASLLISAGAVADRFGRRRVFRLGLVVFAVASVACALAPSAGVLIGARVVQGVGGSMLSPVALAIVVNIFTEPRQRAQAIGVWAAVFGVSMAAGPVVGGALLSGLGWRAVFWLNVPVVAAVLVLTAVFVPESRARQPRRVDGPGQLLLIIVVGGSVALLIEGPRLGWGSPAAVLGYVLVGAAAAGFGWAEARRREPLMDLRLFRRRPFAAAVLGAVAVFVALNATLLLGTLYLQDARGLSPAVAGLVTLPMAVPAIVCAPLAGYLVGRTGPRLPLLLAGGLTTAGALFLVTLDDHTDIRVVLAAYSSSAPGSASRTRPSPTPRSAACRRTGPASPAASPPPHGSSVPPSASPSRAASSPTRHRRRSPTRPGRAGCSSRAAGCSSCSSPPRCVRRPARRRRRTSGCLAPRRAGSRGRGKRWRGTTRTAAARRSRRPRRWRPPARSTRRP